MSRDSTAAMEDLKRAVIDHTAYLLRLVELELIDRERRVVEPPRKLSRQTSLRLPFVQRTKERLTTGWILLRRDRKSPPLQWKALSPPRTLGIP